MSADELTQENFILNGVTFGVSRMESLSHASYANTIICHFTVPEEHVGGDEVAEASQKNYSDSEMNNSEEFYQNIDFLFGCAENL